MTFPLMEETAQQAEHKQHTFGKVWQPFDQASFEEMVGNIARRGLDKEIIRYQDMILEGWHRYLACLAAKVEPTFAEFKGSDLEAAELVHASGVRRQSSADQRYASFLLLCEACPEFKAKYEELKAKADHQKKEGIPLDTGAQRVDVVGAKAEAAGVSKSTAKKVERVKKKNPSAVADIAAGKTTANKEVKKLPKKESKLPKAEGKKASTPTNKNQINVGDTIYKVVKTKFFSQLEVTIYAYKVQTVGKKTYVSTSGKQVKKEEAVTLDDAKTARTKLINNWIADLERELKEQRKSLTKEPKIKMQ